MIGTDQIQQWLTYTGLNVLKRWKRALIVCIYSFVLPIAMTIPNKMNFLNSFSIITLVMLICFCILITIYSVKELFFGSGLSSTAIGYKFGEKGFTSIGVHISTFALPIMVFPIMKNYNPSIVKRKGVVRVVFICTFLLVSIAASFSYLICGDSTKPDVLMSFEKSVMVILLQLCIFIVVTFTYSSIVRSVINQLCYSWFGLTNYENASVLQKIFLISFVNIINVLLAIFISNSSLTIGLGGSFAGCFLCFSFPSICRLKVRKDSLLTVRNIFHIILIIFGIVLTLVCTAFNIIDFVQG
jgi:hypothetical protein